jgi:1-acyl-sn-glycerol-3-phosphate acyltransferase
MLRGIWVRCVLAVITVLISTPVMILTVLVPRWGNLVIHAGSLWARILLAAAGARVTVHGLSHLRTHDPCVFIANHLSIVDVWVMLTIVPPNTRFVAKRELFRIPIFGWALASTGCISIDRTNRGRAIRSLRAAGERIRAGRSVVLFPEGSRSRDGRLAPFKKGAFHLAVQAGVPVVPVAITGSFQVDPPGTLRVTPGPVEVFVEPPIDVEPYRPENYNGLLEEVRDVIARHFQEPGAERDDRSVLQETS